MSRIVVTTVAVLLACHGLLTFAFAITVYPGGHAERLAFAQHGFTFLLIALLNVVAWRLPSRSRVLTSLVHFGNWSFAAFCIAFAVAKPEPPLYVAAILMLALAASACGADISLKRSTGASSQRLIL